MFTDASFGVADCNHLHQQWLMGAQPESRLLTIRRNVF